MKICLKCNQESEVVDKNFHWCMACICAELNRLNDRYVELMDIHNLNEVKGLSYLN